MRTIQSVYKGLDVSISVSSDSIREFSTLCNRGETIEEKIRSYCEALLDRMTPEMLKYIALFSKKTGLRGMRVILAHGRVEDSCWLYKDGEREYDLQTWVEGKDGNYACIFVTSCNPGHITLLTKKSLLVLPDRDVCLIDTQVCFSLLGPYGHGVNSYTIEAAIRDLENEL